MTLVRHAAVAGRFYPGTEQALRAQVDALLAEAGVTNAPAAPKLLIVPHAGYIYSGAVAARAYASLAGRAGQVQRVVLLGPAHGSAVRSLAAPSVQAFETPLGRLPLDRRALDALADLPQLTIDDRAHAFEHSLEVQLPFLQRTLGDGFVLVPLAVGAASVDEVAEVLERLWGGEETLVVISSDLSHDLPYAQAQDVDRATALRIGRCATDLSPQEACGAHALNGALQVLARRRMPPVLLDLRNSGDTAGDRAHVVGYAALVAGGLDPRHPAEDEGDVDAALAPALLASAANAIAVELGLAPVPEPSHPALTQPGACFVTLRDAQGRLRGCIGNTQASSMLARQLRHHARAAAFDDPRFPPLTRAECHGLQLEVSLLSPSRPLPRQPGFAQAAAALCPGRDGVSLQWTRGRATLLPQAWDALPDAQDFLAALMEKAGLLVRGGVRAGLASSDRNDAARAWCDDIALSVYTAQAVAGPGPDASRGAPR